MSHGINLRQLSLSSFCSTTGLECMSTGVWDLGGFLVHVHVLNVAVVKDVYAFHSVAMQCYEMIARYRCMM